MIKRKMSLLLAAVVVASGVGMASPAFAADKTNTVPSITYIAPEHTIAADNVPFTFALQAGDYEGDVQYRIFIQKDNKGPWTELTDGYSEAVNGKTPFIPKVTKNLEAGKYKASVWVKRADVKEGDYKNKLGSYDTFYVKNFSIGKAEALKNRADLNDLGIKDTYKVGEKLTLTGKEGYQYKLHIFDSSAPTRPEGWTIDSKYETAKETTHVFTKPGTYLVDVWGMQPGASDAAKKQGYDAWKLKVVTVTDEVEVKATVEEISAGLTAFDRYVKVSLNVEDPENYEVTVCGQKLEYVKDKKFFQGVVNQTDEAKIKGDVQVKKIGEKVDVPTAKVEKIEAGLTAFDRYVEVTLDSKTPEKFEVEVCGQKLQYVEGKKFFQGVINQTDEAKIKGDVKVTVK